MSETTFCHSVRTGHRGPLIEAGEFVALCKAHWGSEGVAREIQCDAVSQSGQPCWYERDHLGERHFSAGTYWYASEGMNV